MFKIYTFLPKNDPHQWVYLYNLQVCYNIFFSTYLEDEGSEWMMVVVREERETITKNKKN